MSNSPSVIKLAAIVCFADNQVIGLDNKMPWHLSKDLIYFKKTTLHHPVIMGKNTFLSIGKPLPNRFNVVLSSRLKTQQTSTLEIVTSKENALKVAKNYAQKKQLDKVFIMGGQQIYQLFLDQLDFLYITKIQKNFEGDAYFPKVDWKSWSCSEQTQEEKENGLSFYFQVWYRKSC